MRIGINTLPPHLPPQGYEKGNSAYACPLGYAALKGWDAATGLGLPNAAVLSQAAIAWASASSPPVVPGCPASR
jgi:hypothetical protein